MLDLFVATEEGDIQRLRLQPRVSLAGPTYWFLHRYFVQASLTPGDFSFLNLYEDTELAGYQLQRLRTELQEALVGVLEAVCEHMKEKDPGSISEVYTLTHFLL